MNAYKRYHVTFYDLGAWTVKARNEAEAQEKAMNKMIDFLWSRDIDPATVEPEIAVTELVD